MNALRTWARAWRRFISLWAFFRSLKTSMLRKRWSIGQTNTLCIQALRTWVSRACQRFSLSLNKPGCALFYMHFNCSMFKQMWASLSISSRFGFSLKTKPGKILHPELERWSNKYTMHEVWLGLIDLLQDQNQTYRFHHHHYHRRRHHHHNHHRHHYPK